MPDYFDFVRDMRLRCTLIMFLTVGHCQSFTLLKVASGLFFSCLVSLNFTFFINKVHEAMERLNCGSYQNNRYTCMVDITTNCQNTQNNGGVYYLQPPTIDSVNDNLSSISRDSRVVVVVMTPRLQHCVIYVSVFLTTSSRLWKCARKSCARM